jgi:prepilin-type processing-associated H-X9-DG protein
MPMPPAGDGQWGNNPAVTRHNKNGTVFGFADGHAEIWKWHDPRTLRIKSNGEPVQLGNQDLVRLQQAYGGL